MLAALLLATGFWLRNPIVFIAEDCYFYAVVARNLALHGVQSFWGSEPTNGVHPLWLYLLAGYDWVVSWISPDLLRAPAFGVPLVTVITAVGALNFARVAERAELPRAAVVCIPVLFLAAFGLLYSEAHAAFLMHSVLARVVSDEDHDGRPRPVLAGLAAAGVCLARLDNVFYVAAFLGWYAWRHLDRGVAARMLLASTVPLVAYVGSNLVFFGSMVPVSGFLKSTFPLPNVGSFVVAGSGLVVMWSGYSVLFGWIPVGVGALTALTMRRRLTGIRSLVYPLLAGTVLHAIYTGFFTAGFTFWYWYYLLPIVLLAWSLACATAPVVGPRLDQVLQWSAVAALGAALVATRLAPPDEFRLEGLRTLRLVRQFGIERATILVSEWPGTLAFYTRNQVVAADMLTSNRRLVERMQQEGPAALLARARERDTPIEYVLFNGGLFLLPNLDLQSLEYRNPRMVDTLAGRSLGTLRLGPAEAFAEGLFLWRVPATAATPSGR